MAEAHIQKEGKDRAEKAGETGSGIVFLRFMVFVRLSEQERMQARNNWEGH